MISFDPIIFFFSDATANAASGDMPIGNEKSLTGKAKNELRAERKAKQDERAKQSKKLDQGQQAVSTKTKPVPSEPQQGKNVRCNHFGVYREKSRNWIIANFLLTMEQVTLSPFCLV